MAKPTMYVLQCVNCPKKRVVPAQFLESTLRTFKCQCGSTNRPIVSEQAPLTT